MVANVVVVLRGNLAELIGAWLLACGALALTYRIRTGGWRPGPVSPPAAASRDLGAPEPLRPDRPAPIPMRVAAAAGAVAAVAVFAATGWVLGLWMIGVVLLLILAVGERNSVPRWSPPRRSGSWTAGLLVVAILAVIVTLVAHRPDEDDSLYVNLAVATADHPGDALLHLDRLQGIPDLPLALPVYRAQAIELLTGTIAYLTGLQAIDVAHLLLPVLAAFLVPLAYARLFRLLIPQRWIWGVVVVVAYFLLVGDSHWGFANFAFVRLHQGKAVFVSVLLPLTMAYGVEFGLHPTRRGWVRLAAVQVAGVGMTASAVFVAPVVAGLAVASAVPWRMSSMRTFLWGLASSAYLVVLGLWLYRQLPPNLPAGGPEGISPQTAQMTLMGQALVQVFGDGRAALLAFACLLGASAFAATPLLRRFVIVFPLAFCALLWNPVASPWWVENLTGTASYWRFFWVLPVPALVGIVMTAPLDTRWARQGKWPRRVAITALACALLASVSAVYTLSDGNAVDIRWPGRKVPSDEMAVALRMVALAPADSFVLAPLQVSPWITTLREHPAPLVSRRRYLLEQMPRIGVEEVARRWIPTQIASGREHPADTGEILRSAIEHYQLELICLEEKAAGWRDVIDALDDEGFREGERIGPYRLWIKGQIPGLARLQREERSR